MPNPQIKAVLFDYGQVLSGPPDPAAWARMLAITGLDEPAFHAAYWTPRHDYDRGHHSGPAYWRAAGDLAGLDLTPHQISSLMAADNTLWTQLNQPMIDWAARLQAAGTVTGILSNLGDSMVEGVLAALPWLAGFNHLLWSHSVSLAKPDPAIYYHSAEGLHTPPANILFVDDRQENVDGAIAAGMQAVLYATQLNFERELGIRGLSGLWLTGSIV